MVKLQDVFFMNERCRSIVRDFIDNKNINDDIFSSLSVDEAMKIVDANPFIYKKFPPNLLNDRNVFDLFLNKIISLNMVSGAYTSYGYDRYIEVSNDLIDILNNNNVLSCSFFNSAENIKKLILNLADVLILSPEFLNDENFNRRFILLKNYKNIVGDDFQNILNDCIINKYSNNGLFVYYWGLYSSDYQENVDKTMEHFEDFTGCFSNFLEVGPVLNKLSDSNIIDLVSKNPNNFQYLNESHKKNYVLMRSILGDNPFVFNVIKDYSIDLLKMIVSENSGEIVLLLMKFIKQDDDLNELYGSISYGDIKSVIDIKNLSSVAKEIISNYFCGVDRGDFLYNCYVENNLNAVGKKIINVHKDVFEGSENERINRFFDLYGVYGLSSVDMERIGEDGLFSLLDSIDFNLRGGMAVDAININPLLAKSDKYFNYCVKLGCIDIKHFDKFDDSVLLNEVNLMLLVGMSDKTFTIDRVINYFIKNVNNLTPLVKTVFALGRSRNLSILCNFLPNMDLNESIKDLFVNSLSSLSIYTPSVVFIQDDTVWLNNDKKIEYLKSCLKGDKMDNYVIDSAISIIENINHKSLDFMDYRQKAVMIIDCVKVLQHDNVNVNFLKLMSGGGFKQFNEFVKSLSALDRKKCAELFKNSIIGKSNEVLTSRNMVFSKIMILQFWDDISARDCKRISGYVSDSGMFRYSGDYGECFLNCLFDFLKEHRESDNFLNLLGTFIVENSFFLKRYIIDDIRVVEKIIKIDDGLQPDLGNEILWNILKYSSEKVINDTLELYRKKNIKINSLYADCFVGSNAKVDLDFIVGFKDFFKEGGVFVYNSYLPLEVRNYFDEIGTKSVFVAFEVMEAKKAANELKSILNKRGGVIKKNRL